MPNYILIVTVIILLCLFLNKLSSRLGIPVLLAFILLGMLFGTDGLLKISFDNYRILEEICTVSLIFIMFTVVLAPTGNRRSLWRERRYCSRHWGYF